MVDAEWITDLLRHGLIQGSFIPERPQRELRDLVRSRRSLVHNRSQVVNRIQKVPGGSQHQADRCRQQRGRSIGTCHVGGYD